MKFNILSFISLSFHMFSLNQDNAIEKFWKDEKSINYGYYDNIGNIYKYDNNTKTAKMLYSNINHLNSFKYIDDYHLINCNDNKNEKSYIIKNNFFKLLKWNDSTLYETIYNKNYYRINFFGNVYIKNLVNKNSTKLDINMNDIQYYQQMINYNEYLFTINDKNELGIYDIYNKFKEKLSYKLKNSSCVKKVIVDKFGIYYYVLILYKNSLIDIITISHNESSNCFYFCNKNVINNKSEVIDCELKASLVIVSLENKITFYKFTPYAVSVIKLVDKNLSIPYYTSITLIDKFLLYNSYKFIPYILVNYND